jgi:hypothetical protein
MQVRLDDDSARFVAVTRRRARLWIGSIWCLAASMIVVLWQCDRLSGLSSGERDLQGNQVFAPPHEVDTRALARTNLARIHGALIPRWSRSSGGKRARRSMIKLLAATRDPNLRELLTELHEATRDGRPDRHAQRIGYLAWAWNNYLTGQRQPWRMRAFVRRTPLPAVDVATYKVLSALSVRVGPRTQRVELLRRADGSVVAEPHVGHTSIDDGSSVVLDRIYDLAADRIWPLLAPSGAWNTDALHAPRILDEARRALPPHHLSTLVRTATGRRVIARTIRRINGRRRCGSPLWIRAVPFDGFPESGLDVLRAAALERAGKDCPWVTEAEALAVAAASTRLRETSRLRPAVGALTAWVARAVVIHEARHAGDAGRLVQSGLACDGCASELGLRGRAELSAYLAGLGSPDVGYLTLYQACLSLRQGVRGEGAAAIRYVGRMLGQACRRGPPPHLYHRAAWLEGFFFGRSDRILLPPDYPARLPVPDLCPGGAAQHQCWGRDDRRPGATSAAGAVYATWRRSDAPSAAPADLRRHLP